MGFIANLLSFTRAPRHGVNVSDSKVDPGSGANVTLEHFADAGDDSNPLPGDYVASITIRQTGRAIASGYLDPKNPSTAGPGEKRTYARDGDGDQIVEVFLKATGEANINNANGSIVLKPDGEIVLTGPEATITLFVDGATTIENALGNVKLLADGGSELNAPNASVDVNADNSIVASNAGGSFQLNSGGDFKSTNGSGTMELKANGDCDLNGVIITPAGEITLPSGQSVIADSMIVDGNELDDHIHNGVDRGPQATDPLGV